MLRSTVYRWRQPIARLLLLLFLTTVVQAAAPAARASEAAETNVRVDLLPYLRDRDIQTEFPQGYSSPK